MKQIVEEYTVFFLVSKTMIPHFDIQSSVLINQHWMQITNDHTSLSCQATLGTCYVWVWRPQVGSEAKYNGIWKFNFSSTSSKSKYQTTLKLKIYVNCYLSSSSQWLFSYICFFTFPTTPSKVCPGIHNANIRMRIYLWKGKLKYLRSIPFQ